MSQLNRVYVEQLEKFMRAVAASVNCLPSYANPDPEDGNAHIIRAINALKVRDLAALQARLDEAEDLLAQWIHESMLSETIAFLAAQRKDG